jgi:PST family polysaccharide transporter
VSVTEDTPPPRDDAAPPGAPGAPAPSPLFNAATLMTGQIVGLVVPLLTIPYLARVLGPDQWGPVLTAQAFGYWLLLLFEFGFDLSGTRAVARARVPPDEIGGIVHGVQSAKLLLIGFTSPIVVAVVAVLPAVRANMGLFVFAFLFAVLRGLSPLWFFQGIERMKAAVAVDSITRAIAALAVFVLVRGPDDGVWVLVAQAALSGLALVILSAWLYGRVPFRSPNARAGAAMLRETYNIFACRAWISLYIQGNTLILSAMKGATIVAFFGGAEKIVRGAINLIAPITGAYMPRVSYLHASDRDAADRMIRQLLIGMGAFGLLMSIAALAGAPMLVPLFLGPEYQQSIPVVRVLSGLPILSAINTVLGLYWALPFGYERVFLVSIGAAAVTDVALAIALVPRFGAMGMAVAPVAAEVVVLVILARAYWRRARG